LAQPGDVHLNISSPGWAKHAWSCFFAPWIAEATIFVYNYSRFDASALLRQIRAGVNTFFAAIQNDLARCPTGYKTCVCDQLGATRARGEVQQLGVRRRDRGVRYGWHVQAVGVGEAFPAFRRVAHGGARTLSHRRRRLDVAILPT
jgi:hypothetical protein